jgi:hypothetical protein
MIMKTKNIVISVVIVVLVVMIFALIVNQAPEPMAKITNDLTNVPGDSQLKANMKVAGLDVLSQEGTVMHIHQHLDLLINGQVVKIPADIGIGTDFISPIHTHDEENILHVESPVVKNFTLGQFFREWGINFTDQCIGSNCVGNGKKIFIAINGAPVLDAVNYVLKEHDEIEIWYGPMNQMPIIIRSYDFPAGL